jgi:hypothetical protein
MTTTANRSDSQRTQADMRFIQENIEVIAAMAWQGYTAVGRGVVMVDETRSIMGTTIPAFGFPMSYGADSSVRGQQQQWPGQVGGMLDSYDPETGFVVMLIRTQDSTAYRIRAPNLPPPTAYEQYRDVLETVAISQDDLRGLRRLLP